MIIKTILILAANPKATSRLRLDEEIREIEEGLKHSERFRLVQKWAVRQRDFYRAILEHKPQIIHFCGHGEGDGGIVLENEIGQPVTMGTEALSGLFKLFAVKGVECVVLNACYSEVQAKAISQYIKYVVGMNTAIGDKAAINFSVAFYDALAAGENVQFAYDLGCSQLVDLKEDSTPVLNITEIQRADIQFVAGDIPPNPYLGLSAFAEQDAAFFFGREKFTDELFDMAHQQNLVAVIGASGSGKSSVVFAGLIPKLREEATWLVESLRPKSQPFDELALALVRQLEPNIDGVEKTIKVGKLAESLNKGEVKLHQVASQILEDKPNKSFLLVVDQFEELYTQCQDKEQQQRFIDTLLLAVNQKSIILVFTLRADFYGYVLSYRPFSDVLQQITFKPLGLMSRDELKTAIERPAQKLGVKLQTHLAERILNDVGQEPGNLPLLEFALTQLWDKQKNDELTHQTYDEIGGVKQALVKHTEEVYKKLSEGQQQQAQRIFLSLVRLGETTEDTRRVATREEVSSQNWNLVTYLASSEVRLIVTGRDDKSEEETVEVVHEALIREWDTLRKWVNENREKLIQKRKIESAAVEWKEKNKLKEYLLEGRQLQDARVFQKQQNNSLVLSDVAGEFIKASNKQQRVRLLQTSSLFIIPILIAVGIIVPYLRQQSYDRAWETIRNRKQGTRAALELLNEGCLSREIPISALFIGKCPILHKIDLSSANLSSADLRGAKLNSANLNSADLRGAKLNSANLNSADLRGADLRGANLNSANLNSANLKGAEIRGANLEGANLNSANLEGADLSEVNFLDADLRGADLNSANLKGAEIRGANLSRTNLGGANLIDANLGGAKLIDANLDSLYQYHKGADLSEANLRGADLSRANLRGAELNSAYLGEAKLEGANLHSADLSRANLNSAYLGEAKLEGANLNSADLSRADLSRADLSRADLNSANLNSADLSRADLSRANLNSAKLEGANLIGAKLEGADLNSTDLEGANLEGAIFNNSLYNKETKFPKSFNPSNQKMYLIAPGVKLRGAKLIGADLSEVNLRGADLNSAKLIGADLKGANLYNANLVSADLVYANLYNANLSNADLKGANLVNANLYNANLSNADLKGADLDLVKFWHKESGRKAENITPSQIKEAKNWEKAVYSPEFRKELGLPPSK